MSGLSRPCGMSGQYAFGVTDAQLLMHEPFGSGAAAVTDVVLTTAGAGTTAHLTIVIEEARLLPDFAEALCVQVACLELWSLEEGTRVDLAFGTDTAGRGCRTTGIQSGQLVSEGVEVKERIGGKHVGMRTEPDGKFAVLLLCRVQVFPHIAASTGGTQAGDAQFCAEAGGNLIEPI